jgi:hypothetical protein
MFLLTILVVEKPFTGWVLQNISGRFKKRCDEKPISFEKAFTTLIRKPFPINFDYTPHTFCQHSCCNTDWPFVIITVKTLNFHGKFWEFKNMVSGNLRSRSASNDKLLFTIIVKKICRWCFRTPVLFYYYPTIHLLLIPMSICTSQSLLSHPYVVNELLDRHCDAQNRHRN